MSHNRVNIWPILGVLLALLITWLCLMGATQCRGQEPGFGALIQAKREIEWQKVRPTIEDSFDIRGPRKWFDELRLKQETKFTDSSPCKSFTFFVGPQDFGGTMPRNFTILIPRNTPKGFFLTSAHVYYWENGGTKTEMADHLERERGRPTWVSFTGAYGGEAFEQREYEVCLMMEPVE